MASNSFEKIKVLVLGDSGVGKTSLVHLICKQEPIQNPSWTIGCSIEVKIHEYSEGTPQQKTYMIELWDVGGSRGHAIARSVFYSNYHGIILVHDLTNKKSYLNLRKWLGQVLYSKDNTAIKENTASSLGFTSSFKENTSSLASSLLPVDPTCDDYDFDPEAFSERNIPVLFIGTKLDQVSSSRRTSESRYPGSYGRIDRRPFSSLSEECGAEELEVSCYHSRSFSPGSTNAVKLSRFFDKVIKQRYRASGHISSFLPPRNKPTTSTSPLWSKTYSHLD